MKENPISFQMKLNPDDFLPATNEEKESLVVMRESVSFWKDGFRRLRKNKVAMVSLVVIILIMILSFIVPSFYPYSYKTQIKGANNLAPMQYSADELARIDAGESVFPHILGTDKMGRDYAIRVMMGSRISLMVGLIATAIILVIGSIYGSVAAFFGGWVDLVMMRIVDIIYSVPAMLYIVLIMLIFGASVISIMLGISITCWIDMARIVRQQVKSLKEQEFTMAAFVLGASPSRILIKHLLINTMGQIIVTVTLMVPQAIFTEAWLSFLGVGISAPMASWGTLAQDARQLIMTYPMQTVYPMIAICITIFSFNFVGEGLEKALDPKRKR